VKNYQFLAAPLRFLASYAINPRKYLHQHRLFVWNFEVKLTSSLGTSLLPTV